MLFCTVFIILNSGVAIPGSRSRLDFARVRTFYRCERSWIASGGAKGKGAITGRPPTLFPADAGTPSIDRHNRRWHTQNGQGKGLQGKCDRGSAMADRATGGESPCLPPARMLLDNRSVSWADGHAHWLTAAGSLAPWHTCQTTDVEHDGGTRLPTGPQMLGMGDPRPAVGHGRTISRHFKDLSCSL